MFFNHPVFKSLKFDSVTVARAIRYAGKIAGYQLNMTQINKLLYIAYGILLVQNKLRLTKEHPFAYPYGPVFPRVLKKVKLSDPITNIELLSFPAAFQDLIKEVVFVFGKFPANRLYSWSIKDNSPWSLAIQANKKRLDDEVIYDYFYNFVKEADIL